MTRWILHPLSGANIEIEGSDLSDAVTRHWATVAESAGLSGLIGYTLERVRAEYRTGILGGKGGIELRITFRPHGPLDLGPAGHPRDAVAWIHARPNDLPLAEDIPIRQEA